MEPKDGATIGEQTRGMINPSDSEKAASTSELTRLQSPARESRESPPAWTMLDGLVVVPYFEVYVQRIA